jgi:hypothetical protein
MRFTPTALALFLCSAQQAMLRSTVASFAITKAIARKPNGALSLATSRLGPRCAASTLFSRGADNTCPSVTPYTPKPWMLARGGASNALSTTALNSAVAEAETAAPTEVFRTDYKPLPHLVTKINMDFKIEDGKTTVTSELFIEPNSQAAGVRPSDDLVLDGDETCVKLMSVSIDGKELEKGKDYELAPQKLIIKSPKPGTVLKTVVEIVPEENTQLSGLYKSGSMYCSQVGKCVLSDFEFVEQL